MKSDKDKLAKILVVDDEKDVLKSLVDTLEDENYVVKSAMTGKEALKSADKYDPNLIILDLRLPDMDGYDVCRQLKENQKTKAIPIIMVSTRSKETEKVVGLEIGADDYVVKPYNAMELLARIRVALRRTMAPSEGDQQSAKEYKSGDLTVNLELRKVTLGSKVIKLTPKEYDILVMLISKPGKPFSRHTLMASIWGHSYNSLHGTIDSHILSLRKKLGKMAHVIETIPGIGYRFGTGS